MIKKYLVCGVLCMFCCPIFSGTQANLSKTEQELINSINKLAAKIEKMTPAQKTDLLNALINNKQTIKTMGLEASEKLAEECRSVRNSYITYMRTKEKKLSDEPTKKLFELLEKSNGLLTIFIVGASSPKDNEKPYRFVLSKVEDPMYAQPLEEISAETRDEMRRNLQFMNEYKKFAIHLVQRLEPLTNAIG